MDDVLKVDAAGAVENCVFDMCAEELRKTCF